MDAVGAGTIRADRCADWVIALTGLHGGSVLHSGLRHCTECKKTPQIEPVIIANSAGKRSCADPSGYDCDPRKGSRLRNGS